MQMIKTVSHSSESEFDKEVNALIADGWSVDLSTYRTAGYGFSYASKASISPSQHNADKGCYNSVILTKS